MVRIYFILLISFFPLLAVAQKTIPLTSPAMDKRFFDSNNIPTVKGKLLNYSPTAFRNIRLDYKITVPIEGNQIARNAKIQADGSFELLLKHAFPYQQIHLELGTYYVGEIIANDSLFIELDMEILALDPVRYIGKGVQFGGKDAGINVYTNRFNNYQNSKKGSFYKARQEVVMNNNLDLTQQRTQFEAAYQIWDELMANYIEAYPSEYEWAIQNERDSDYYAWLFTMYWQKEMPTDLLEKALTHQPLLVSQTGMNYYKYLCRLMKLVTPVENFELTQNVLYDRVVGEESLNDLKAFLEQYELKIKQKAYDDRVYQRGVRQFVNTNQEEFKQARLDVFARNLMTLDTRLADVLKLFGAPYNKWKKKKYYTKFLPLTATGWVSTFMIEKVGIIEEYTASFERTLTAAATITSNTSLGSLVLNDPSYGAALYVGQETQAKKFVATLQNAFPNKALILDIWATWCRPCIVDMERSAAKKAAMKDLPVEVIYIAISDGSSQQKWEQTVNKLKVSGNHIYIGKELADSLLKDFNLFGYPSFIFVDRNGNWDTNFMRSISNIDLDKLKSKL